MTNFILGFCLLICLATYCQHPANAGQDVKGNLTVTNGALAVNDLTKTSTIAGLQFFNNQMTTASAGTISIGGITTNLQVNGIMVMNNKTAHTFTSDAATGSNVTLTAPTKKYVKLTAAGTLISIDGIPAGSGLQELVLINTTGAPVSINHNTGATSANQISTSTKSPIELPDRGVMVLVYDTTEQKWLMPEAPMAIGDQLRLAVYAYFPGTASCAWSKTINATVGAFATTTACPGPTIHTQNRGTWLTTDSNLPRVSVNSLPAGQYKATFIVQQYNAANSTPVFAINDGTTTCESQGATESTLGGSVSITCIFNYTSAGNRSFELFGANSTTTMTVRNDNNTSGGVNTKFLLEYYGSDPSYLSRNANYGPIAYTPTITTFSGSLTNYTVTATHQRIGNLLFVDGKIVFTGAPGTWNTPFISLPPGISSPVTTTVYLPAGGSVIDASPAGAYQIVVGNSSSGIFLVGTTASLTNAFPITFASGDSISFKFQVEVPAWQNSDVTISPFSEVMTTPGITKPKTCYYAFGGASATLAAPTVCAASPCIEVYDSCGAIAAPTRTSTGIYPFVVANGTFANSSFVNCVPVCGSNGGARICSQDLAASFMITNSSGGLSGEVLSYNQAGTVNDSYVSIKCEGQAP